MAGTVMRPCGDFRTSYAADTTIFEDRASRNWVIFFVALAVLIPLPTVLGLGFDVVDRLMP